MTRVILYTAVSVDGWIADANGGVEWLESFGLEGVDMGYEALLARTHTLILGGVTYRQVLGFGEWPYRGKDVVVLTHQPLTDPPDERVSAYQGDVGELVARLKREAAGDVWLVGGGQVNALFAAHGLIDEYRLFVMPLLLGDGVPLFKPFTGPRPLRLADTKSYPNGVLELVYVPVDLLAAPDSESDA